MGGHVRALPPGSARRALLTLVVLTLALLAPAGPAGATERLFDRLGGEAGINRIVGDLLARATRDGRIAWSFENTNVDRLRRLLGQQFCALSGGPCALPERTMASSHRHLNLAERHFNALVEDLQDAMDAQGTPFRTQLELLALLAPMKKEVVAP